MAECLNFSNALSELRQPFHCNIRITNKCNFSCTYCYAASERLNSNNLSIEKARLIANWIFLYSKITNEEDVTG